MSDPTVSAIVDRSADPASVAWAHDGVGNVAALPDPLAAITAAGLLGNAKALQAVAAPKELRKAASAALHKLKSKGIKIEEVAAPRAFTLAKEGFDLAPRAFLSLPDLQGDIELLVTTSDPTGNCALGMLLGAGGVKEMRHAHLGRGDLRDVWKQAQGRAEIAEIPFAVGLHYAERYATTSADHKHDWTHFLEHISAATLAGARALDPMTRVPEAVEEGEDPNPRWLAPLGALDESALQAGIADVVALMGNPGDDDSRDAALEAIYARTADTALADGDPAALARAAELAAAAVAFHGRPRGAAMLSAQVDAILAGAAGSAVEGVAMGVRLLLLSQAQQQLGGRIQAINDQIAAVMGPELTGE